MSLEAKEEELTKQVRATMQEYLRCEKVDSTLSTPTTRHQLKEIWARYEKLKEELHRVKMLRNDNPLPLGGL